MLKLKNKQKKKRYIKKQRYQERKKCDKVDSYLQQVKQGPYYICTICHKTCINVVSDSVSMKNIIYSPQICIVQ